MVRRRDHYGIGLIVIALAAVEARQAGNAATCTALDEYEIRQLYVRFLLTDSIARPIAGTFLPMFSRPTACTSTRVGGRMKGVSDWRSLRERIRARKSPTNVSHYLRTSSFAPRLMGLWDKASF